MSDKQWWQLDGARINHLQQRDMEEIVKRARGAHFVDVHVRINGKWEIYQADWIKHLTPRQRPIVTTWRSFTYALGRRVARFKAMMPWRRQSLAACGAAGSELMQAGESEPTAQVMPDTQRAAP